MLQIGITSVFLIAIKPVMVNKVHQMGSQVILAGITKELVPQLRGLTVGDLQKSSLEKESLQGVLALYMKGAAGPNKYKPLAFYIEAVIEEELNKMTFDKSTSLWKLLPVFCEYLNVPLS